MFSRSRGAHVQVYLLIAVNEITPYFFVHEGPHDFQALTPARHASGELIILKLMPTHSHRLIWLAAGSLFMAAGIATGSDQKTQDSSRPVTLILQPGISAEGAATPAWREVIRSRHSEEMMSKLLAAPRKFSEEEALWADLIKQKVPTWSGMIDSLRIPFQATTPPDTIFILLGNQGGEDAFTYSLATIGFDLSKLDLYYGSASTRENHERIDRFFAHEMTHVLHKAWRKKSELAFKSPFMFALWECLTEGLGNYRSLSGKWLMEKGQLTQHAQAVLQRLQPIFVERISALEHATEADAASLMEGLSSGAFDQKWGALTVALWLAQEAKGDDHNLRKWVEAGPAGVLVLANKYLPDNLRERLPVMD